MRESHVHPGCQSPYVKGRTAGTTGALSWLSRGPHAWTFFSEGPKLLPCQNGSEIISHGSVCIPPWRKGLTVELSAASQHINPFSIAITKYLGLGNRAWSHPHSRSGKGLLADGFTKARMFGEIRNQSCSVSSGQLTPGGTNQGPRKAL